MIYLKLKKLSFILIIIFSLVLLVSFNVHANVSKRSLPTIYKVTGNLDISAPGNNYYFLVAAVDNYAVGKSNCNNYESMKTQLRNGIFIGPIPSDIVGFTSKSFNLKLIIKQYSSLSACNSANNGIVLNEGQSVQGVGN